MDQKHDRLNLFLFLHWNCFLQLLKQHDHVQNVSVLILQTAVLNDLDNTSPYFLSQFHQLGLIVRKTWLLHVEEVWQFWLLNTQHEEPVAELLDINDLSIVYLAANHVKNVHKAHVKTNVVSDDRR